MSTRAAVSQLPLLAIPSNLAPLGKLAGLFVAAVGLCAAAHQFARRDVVSPSARYFSPRRLLFGVGAMKAAFKVVFATALILGLVSTVAANVSLVTAPQVLTSN